jgi:hypothetical protein
VSSRDKGPSILWPIATSLAILVLLLVALVAAIDDRNKSSDDRGPYLVEQPDVFGPMPCAEDEVFVWDDYPVIAECLSNDDHIGHAG